MTSVEGKTHWMDYTGEDLAGGWMKGWALVLMVGLSGPAIAQTCVTQSQMKDAERQELAGAAAAMAAKIQANDAASVRASTIAEFQGNFGGIADEIAAAAPKLAGATPEVEQIYILDANSAAKTASGANPDVQFFCNLNQTPNEAEFAIPQLPPGKYAFAMVRMEAANPMRLSFLLRQDGGRWLLAGLYPKQLTLGGHDGLWYWQQARALNQNKEPWSAWLYLEEAQSLLLPAGFVSSTHLEKLQTELGTTAPPVVANGLSADAPMVLKAGDGSEFRVTAMGVDDSLRADRPDVTAHIKVDALGDPAAARKRNVDAMTALVAAHPELRKAFHGMWVFSDAPGQAPYGTELAMGEIR